MFDMIRLFLIIWDPYDVIGYGPIDEYDKEASRILDMIKRNYDTDELKEYIKSIDVSRKLNDAKIYEFIKFFTNYSE